MPALINQNTLEVSIYGRAGQGAKSAAQLLAEAGLAEGHYVQAFPQYGPERRGAPVYAYARISTSPIEVHGNVLKPQAFLVLDQGLIPSFLSNLDKDYDGLIIVNSKESFSGEIPSARIFTFDASEIARHFLGRNLPNVAMLGAFLYFDKTITLSGFEKVLRAHYGMRLPKAMVEKNVLCLKQGFKEARRNGN